MSKLNTDLTTELDLEASNSTEAIKQFDASVSKQEQIIREMVCFIDLLTFVEYKWFLK